MKRILCIWLPGLSDADASPSTTPLSLATVAQGCMRFSPLVGLESSPSPESVFMDITRVAHLFGGEASLLETMVRDFTSRGLSRPLRAAIADTIGAAWAIAHFGEEKRGQSPFVRSTLRAVPANGDCPLFSSEGVLVPVGETLDWLRPLPVEALRLPEQTVAILHQLGIRRIEQLEALPRRELLSRFGPHLLEHWDRAVGQLSEPLPAYQPPPRFAASWSPEYPTARRDILEAALEHLADRVAAMLVESGRGATQLECRLECVSGDPIQVSVGLFHPTASKKQLIELIEIRFERICLPSPVRLVHLAVSIDAPLELRQQELFFEGQPRRQPRHWAGLINRLSNRLGRDAVVRVRLVPDAQPELAYRYVPMVDRGGRCTSSATTMVPGLSSSVGNTVGQASSGTPQRPLRLLASPIPLAAGHPSLLEFSGRSHEVAETWGPERIETGWWRGHPVGRDYYRVETTTGRRFWIFRRLEDDRWFLHGMFE